MGGMSLSLLDLMHIEAPPSDDDDDESNGQQNGACSLMENAPKEQPPSQPDRAIAKGSVIEDRGLPPGHSEWTLAKTAVKPERILSVPSPEEFKFDVSCVICWKDSAPSVYFCGEGHVTCKNCFNRGEYFESEAKSQKGKDFGLGTCHAKLEEADCGSIMMKLNDSSPILKTPYFRLFREKVPFKCGAAVYGCNHVARGSDLLRHEAMECQFRALRYCGFRNLDNCVESFHDIESHLIHLFEDHNVPFFWNADANFLVKYDRPNFMEVNGKPNYNVAPLLRGIIRGGRKKAEDFYCLLFAKDMMVDDFKFTRIWFCSGTALKNYDLMAECCILPPPKQMVDMEGQPKRIHVQHKTVSVLPDIVSSLIGEFDVDTVFDLPNDTLNTIKIMHEKEKYFTLSVVINIVQKDTRKKVVSVKEFSDPERIMFQIQDMEREIDEIDSRPYLTHFTREEEAEELKLQARREVLKEKVLELKEKLEDFDLSVGELEEY